MSEPKPSSNEKVIELALLVFGPSRNDIAIGLAAVSIYRADPETFERFLSVLEADGLPLSPDKAAACIPVLKRRLDELEADKTEVE